MPVTLTEAAARHVTRYLARRGKGVGVRLGVKTTGCSGLAYKLEYADELAPEDIVFEGHGVKVLIDPKSVAQRNRVSHIFIQPPPAKPRKGLAVASLVIAKSVVRPVAVRHDDAVRLTHSTTFDAPLAEVHAMMTDPTRRRRIRWAVRGALVLAAVAAVLGTIFNVLIAIALSLGAIEAASAQASVQAYPSRPLTMVVPYPAGGTTDVVMRLMSERLQRAFGQPFVIENRGGASGIIGTEIVAKAPNDGYTLLSGRTPWGADAPSSRSGPTPPRHRPGRIPRT